MSVAPIVFYNCVLQSTNVWASGCVSRFTWLCRSSTVSPFMQTIVPYQHVAPRSVCWGVTSAIEKFDPEQRSSLRLYKQHGNRRAALLARSNLFSGHQHLTWERLPIYPGVYPTPYPPYPHYRPHPPCFPNLLEGLRPLWSSHAWPRFACVIVVMAVSMGIAP